MAAAPKSKPHSGPGADAAPGLAVRRIAAEIVDGVLRRNRSLDEQLDGAGANAGLAGLSDRDRALTRALVATVVRRLGTLRHLIGVFVERGLPKEAPRTESALLIGAAQIFSSTCPIMPPSISPSVWCRRIVTPPAMPAWLTPCSAVWRAKAPSVWRRSIRSPSTRRNG